MKLILLVSICLITTAHHNFALQLYDSPVQFCLLGGKIFTIGDSTIRLALSENIKIMNLGPSVNTSKIEYAPSVSADGRKLYFVSNRPGSIKILLGNSSPQSDTLAKNETLPVSHDIWAVGLLESRPNDKAMPYNIDTISTKTNQRGLNSQLNEGASSISADRKRMYFTGCDREDGFGQCDIYYCDLQPDGSWGQPKNMGRNINSEQWESSPSISSDGKRLYFSSNRLNLSSFTPDELLVRRYWNQLAELYSKRKSKADSIIADAVNSVLSNSENIHQRMTKVWRSYIRIIDSTGTIPESDAAKLSEALSNVKDISSIKIEITTGSIDIWYSDFNVESGEWQQPVNISAINTSGKEFSPFICADGRTLFFSSDSINNGYGGLDFYVTHLNNDGTWQKPANLGKPLNTPEDDMFLSIPSDNDIIYFSSRRSDIPGAQGNFDLYMACVSERCSMINSFEPRENQPSTAMGGTSITTPNISFFTEDNKVAVEITLPQAANVSIKAYDFVGREAASLFGEKFESGGKYIIPLNLSGLASGAYFFRILLGSYSITQGFAISR